MMPEPLLPLVGAGCFSSGFPEKTVRRMTDRGALAEVRHRSLLSAWVVAAAIEHLKNSPVPHPK